VSIIPTEYLCHRWLWTCSIFQSQSLPLSRLITARVTSTEWRGLEYHINRMTRSGISYQPNDKVWNIISTEWQGLEYHINRMTRSGISYQLTFSCPVIEHFMWIEPVLRGYLSYKDIFLCSNTGLTVPYMSLGWYDIPDLVIQLIWYSRPCHSVDMIFQYYSLWKNLWSKNIF
jgi:hypothetical protein